MRRDIREWWNVQDAAVTLGRTTQRVYQLIQAGQLRVERTCGGILIDPETTLTTMPPWLSALPANALAYD